MLNSSLLRNRLAVTRCTSHVQCILSDHCTLSEQFSILLLWSVYAILSGQIIVNPHPQDELIQCHISTGDKSSFHGMVVMWRFITIASL